MERGCSSALKLGEALASRLNAIVPSPLLVSAEEPSFFAFRLEADVIVWVTDGGGHGFSNSDLKPHDDVTLGDAACDMGTASLRIARP